MTYLQGAGLAVAVLLASACGSDEKAVVIPDPTREHMDMNMTSTTVTDERLPEPTPAPIPEEPTPEPEPQPEPAPAPEPILCSGYSHPLHHLTCDEANDAVTARRAKEYSPPATVRQPATVARSGGDLASIRECESGGDYTTNTGNGFSGAYQFMDSTWQAAGGSTQSAYQASPEEQDRVAANHIAAGNRGAWPNC